MSKISEADVDYVAGLAQLELDSASRERMVQDLGKILGYMDKLNELNTEGVEPMMHAMELSNVFREDVVEASLPRDVALALSPCHDDEYFLVPKILDTESA